MATAKKHILANLTILHPRKAHSKKEPDLRIGGLAVYANDAADAKAKLEKSYEAFRNGSKDDSEFRAFLRSKNVVEGVVVYAEAPLTMEEIEITAP